MEHSGNIGNIGSHLKESCDQQTKIILEAVTCCPDCRSFMSVVAYELKPDRVQEVLAELEAAMERMGIEKKKIPDSGMQAIMESVSGRSR